MAPSRTAITINGFASSSATNSRIAALNQDRVIAGPALPAKVSGSSTISNNKATLRISNVTIATTIATTNNRQTNSAGHRPGLVGRRGLPSPDAGAPVM